MKTTNDQPQPTTIDEILLKLWSDGFSRGLSLTGSPEAKQALAEWIKSKKPELKFTHLDSGLARLVHIAVDEFEQALLADLEGSNETS